MNNIRFINWDKKCAIYFFVIPLEAMVLDGQSYVLLIPILFKNYKDILNSISNEIKCKVVGFVNIKQAFWIIK